MKKIIFSLSSLLLLASQVFGGEILDINAVTRERMINLEIPISETLISAIIQYRESNGVFLSPEDLKKVPGMSEEDFRTLYPFLLNGKVVIEVDVPVGISPY